ncbi:GH116 family glycosyl hydrolase [Armatimonas sp.]|uniref:GH116 family glycosyl hydrolase n=1 Tax=Armatimonas sp. TaxID=1872638 RepID=UPI00374D305D
MIYEGAKLLQIAMPMGGIGAGTVCLNGHGGLQDFSIRHKPTLSALPDGHGYYDGAFALLHIKGETPITRLVEGPLPPEKLYDQGLQAQGYRKGGHEGLPRFSECSFESRYPFGTVTLSDPKVPVAIELTGWSPFIPGDEKASGIPAAILHYKLTNTSDKPLSIEFSYHWAHPVQGKGGEKGTRNRLLKNGQGVYFTNTDDPESETFGSAALMVNLSPSNLSPRPPLPGARELAGKGGENSLCPPFPKEARLPGRGAGGEVIGEVRCKAMWLRGGWFDSLSALWREVESGQFKQNDGSASEGGLSGRNGGSVLVERTLAPGQSEIIPIVLAWHFPNVGWGVGGTEKQWKPWYTTQWSDAEAAAEYIQAKFTSLWPRTCRFAKVLHDSTLPPAVLDAIASNLAILKSPTVLRQANGNLWGWEGCFTQSGCCHGTCTHVWNYAQALPHLFPALERTLREQEYLRSMDGRGHVNFRAALPDAPTSHDYHAASDGQLGGILKLWREWQISGDTAWLARLYPLAKRSLDFCIAAWDPERRGVLTEPHHNTYDIEFWGAEGMCSSIYIGALSAMAGLAAALQKPDEATVYQALAQSGAAFLDTELFNGEYYPQTVQWEGLRDTSFSESLTLFEEGDEWGELLKREGPKYQYGTGCLSDGVIGAWMASLYGVETPLRKDHIASHLKAVFTHNFKPDLFEHACLQRPSYALGHEPGLLLCTWPHGGKPTLPFVYSDEVWTGIEYQVASHCIQAGLVAEGLAIVEATRSRYEGHVRNPFNEYECGSYYARAMASYALLQACTGFRYSAVTQTLEFGPRVPYTGTFQSFFSTATGFGTISLTNSTLTVTMAEGELDIARTLLHEKYIGYGTARDGQPLIFTF